MAPVSLPDLAPELIIHIYKSMHNFKDTSSLSKTSHKMHDLFDTNITSICNTVLPRAINSYAQACDLFIAQQEFAAANPPLVDPAQIMIHRVKWFLSAAHAAKRALLEFENAISRITEAESGYSNCYGRRAPCLSKRSDFTKAYYRVITLVTLARSPYPPELFDSWNVLEFIQFRMVFNFLCYWCPLNNRLWMLWYGAEMNQMNQVFENQAGRIVMHSNWFWVSLVTRRLETALRRLPPAIHQLPSLTFDELPLYSHLSWPWLPQNGSCKRGASLKVLTPLVSGEPRSYSWMHEHLLQVHNEDLERYSRTHLSGGA